MNLAIDWQSGETPYVDIRNRENTVMFFMHFDRIVYLYPVDPSQSYRTLILEKDNNRSKISIYFIDLMNRGICIEQEFSEVHITLTSDEISEIITQVEDEMKIHCDPSSGLEKEFLESQKIQIGTTILDYDAEGFILERYNDDI